MFSMKIKNEMPAIKIIIKIAPQHRKCVFRRIGPKNNKLIQYKIKQRIVISHQMCHFIRVLWAKCCLCSSGSNDNDVTMWWTRRGLNYNNKQCMCVLKFIKINNQTKRTKKKEATTTLFVMMMHHETYVIL